jgi:hypothetical protein
MSKHSHIKYTRPEYPSKLIAAPKYLYSDATGMLAFFHLI